MRWEFLNPFNSGSYYPPSSPLLSSHFISFHFAPLCELDLDGSHEQLQTDARFLCSDSRLDPDLLDRLVLQLNRIHPQILSDEEAHRVANGEP